MRDSFGGCRMSSVERKPDEALQAGAYRGVPFRAGLPARRQEFVQFVDKMQEHQPVADTLAGCGGVAQIDLPGIAATIEEGPEFGSDCLSEEPGQIIAIACFQSLDCETEGGTGRDARGAESGIHAAFTQAMQSHDRLEEPAVGDNCGVRMLLARVHHVFEGLANFLLGVRGHPGQHMEHIHGINRLPGRPNDGAVDGIDAEDHGEDGKREKQDGENGLRRLPRH